MPHAASISPLPMPPALHALPVSGGAQGTHGKGAVAGREFGELFREQTALPQAPASQSVNASPKSGEETSPTAPPGRKAQAAPALNNEQAETEAALTEPEELTFANATIASSMPVRSLAASSNQLHPAANGANANGAKLSKTLSEAAAIPSAPVESTIKSKKIGSTLASTALSPQHKTKEDDQAGSQTTLSSGGQPESPIVPVVAPAAKPAAVLSPERVAALPASRQWIRPASGEGSTVAIGIPLKATPANDYAAAPQAQQSNGSQLAPSAAPSQKGAIVPAEGSGVLSSAGTPAEAGVPSKDLSGSSSPAPPSALPPHAVHTAEQVTGAAIAHVASSATPTETAGSSPAPTATTANPIAAAPANAAVNLASNPYDRIDQGATPLVLHSGAQHVAVGVHDPELGWVEIKTQNVAGHVDATLITASGQTHTSLAAQLPAMAQYLEQSDIKFGTLAVHHETSGNIENSNSGNGSGYGSGDGSGGNGAGPGSFNQSGSGNSAKDNSVSPGLVTEAIATDEPPMYRPVSYISVRA